MNMKDILENYNEFVANYYMNEQELIDNDADRKIAEAIATKVSIKNSRMKGVD